MTSNLILNGNAGATYRLDSSPKEAISISHPEGVVTVQADKPYVSVSLWGMGNTESVRCKSFQVVQEALDFWAARTRTALSTTHGDQEYSFWIKNDKGYALTYVYTGNLPWSMSANIQEVTTSSNIEELTIPTSIHFSHHQSLRFYRLSQLSPDLLDAYRNAYLALECLISAESPKKPRESELLWLERVIKGPFASGVPEDLNIAATLKDLYKDGRNPIFHAKANETFYAPGGPDRESIQKRFETLTRLLNSLLRFKLGNNVVGGWGEMSQSVKDATARAVFGFDELCLGDGKREATFSPDVRVFDKPRRFGNLWCRASVKGPLGLESISELRLKRNSEMWMNCFIFKPLSLLGIDFFTFELNLLQGHVKAPRTSHPR